MKANPIFVFLVLAPLLLQLFTGEPAEDRAQDRPTDTKTVETPRAPAPRQAPRKKTDERPAPVTSAGGSTEPAKPTRMSPQDAVTFM